MHRLKRKLSSKTLSDEVIQKFEPIMIDYMDTLCWKLIEDLDSSNWPSPKDMIDLCKRLNTDIMGDYGFGQKMGMMKDASLTFILDVLQSYSWRMGVYE
ncbi:hypothetical protein N7G274_003206 [Stereocaulon virgatum]|uniref:Uncharacterized protein n=1 Tax=Stereocaulon virgatum TaxID=373712 RepID=A0ABR4AG61_9LECA